MKKIIDKALEIPVQYTLGIGIVSVIVATMAMQGEMTLLSGLAIASIAILIGMQMYFGSIVIKSVAAFIGIMYMASIYTNIVMSVYGNVVEPFLLTLAGTAIFLSVTYSPKRRNHGIRSRVVWSTVITAIISSVKMSLVISGFSFLIAEIVGMNILVVLIALWMVWLNNSKKTRVVSPIINKTENVEKFRFIYIDNQLDVANNTWIGSHFDGNKNAYPFIYSEVQKAKEEGLSLVIISTVKTNEIYDVGRIKTSRPKDLIYLYMEAKEKDYVNDIMKDFVEELSR